ncbi:MFS transporter [Xenorhabdus bovienii]|uniref:MFS transporter n=1 Tax=Xenorhabdus bovienii TaxID=40576 RepID=UPI0009E1AF5E|nr:MFS transporter [Xenorhabdus bovienii]
MHYVSQGKTPLFDFDLLKNKQFSLGCLLVLFVYSTASSFFLVFALFLQNGLGFTPLDSGLIFAPASVGFVLSSLNASYWVKRFGSQAIVMGALLYSVSFIALIFAVATFPVATNLLLIVLILILLGYGQGFVMTPLLNIVLAFIHVRFSGMAAGIIATLQQIGAALGVAIVSVLVQWQLNNTDALSFITFYLLKKLHRK